MNRNDLISLVLKARGQNGEDHVHVESAAKLADEFIAQHPVTDTPAPTEPTTPAPAEPEEPSTPEPQPEPSVPEEPAETQPEEPEQPTATDLIDLYNPIDQIDTYLGQYPALTKIAIVPNAKWFNYSDNGWTEMRDFVNKAAGTRALVCLYAIFGRDNGNYSAGGAPSKQAYYDYIGALADAMGDAPIDMVIEPDALGLSTELDSEKKKQDRYDMIASAIDTFSAKKNVRVYLDASMWHGVDRQKQLLDKIWNFNKADGTSLNTSGFEWTDKCDEYAEKLMLLTGKPSVIDTSRNGNGPWQTSEKDPWCNPPGRKLGQLPTFDTGKKHVAAYYWVKAPGESDGDLRGLPAGRFMPEYALGLL